MRSRFIAGLTLSAGMVLAAGVTAPGFAADKKAAAPDAKSAMMMQMQKSGSPGPSHAILQLAAGHWTHTIRMWMKPGDTPQESQGTSENSIVMGGRFLKQEAKGTFAGQPFEGMGLTGYDNIRGEYQSVWIDNMGTAMMMSNGTYDPATKAIRQSGTISCPMTGDKAMWYRTEWKIIDADNQTYVMYGKGPDGKEFKSMEIVYKRAK